MVNQSFSSIIKVDRNTGCLRQWLHRGVATLCIRVSILKGEDCLRWSLERRGIAAEDVHQTLCAALAFSVEAAECAVLLPMTRDVDLASCIDCHLQRGAFVGLPSPQRVSTDACEQQRQQSARHQSNYASVKS